MTPRNIKNIISSTKFDIVPFYPTISDVKRWSDVLNFIMFDGKVTKWGKIKVRRMKSYAWCEPYYNGHRKPKCELNIRNKFASFSMFYSVLAHEMVHLAEFTKLGELKHGDFFFDHKEMLANIGIKLRVKYKEHPSTTKNKQNKRDK
jgi:hypothetical protein